MRFEPAVVVVEFRGLLRLDPLLAFLDVLEVYDRLHHLIAAAEYDLGVLSCAAANFGVLCRYYLPGRDRAVEGHCAFDYAAVRDSRFLIGAGGRRKKANKGKKYHDQYDWT